MQYLRHFGLEGGVPPLHVGANLVRAQFPVAQDFVQFGSTQPFEGRLSGCDALPAHMGGRQFAGPQFVAGGPIPDSPGPPRPTSPCAVCLNEFGISRLSGGNRSLTVAALTRVPA